MCKEKGSLLREREREKRKALGERFLGEQSNDGVVK
jgi:hypothetical protein